MAAKKRLSTLAGSMEKTDTNPADYIASLPDGVREDITRLDAAISDAMSDHDKTMWEGIFWGGSDQSIIGYGSFTYERSGGKTVEWFMVGLAAQKSYISVYVNAVDDDGYLTAKYADRLGKAKIGASSIGFTSVEDIDFNVLMELVEKASDQMPGD